MQCIILIIGPQAKLEKFQSFEGQPLHVHEAPLFVPETKELFYTDTSVTGWQWTINLDTHEVSHLQYYVSSRDKQCVNNAFSIHSIS